MRISPSGSSQNTLRLSQAELKQMLEEIDQRSAGDGKSPEREFVRWSYHVEAVQLVIVHGTGNKVKLPVATRNISRGGISILHSSYVHAKTRVEVILNAPGKSQLTITGTVMRSQHLSGRVHEIGIRFDKQISTKDLLGLDPLNEAYSLERVDPHRLHGLVLIVTTSELDRDLMLMFLEDTNLIINTADSIENAIARASKGCELIVADHDLGDTTSSELIAALSGAGCDMPVIVLTSDKSESTRDSIRESNAAGILSKPTSKEKLMQALAEFLHADGDGGPLYSSLKPDDSAYPLLAKFLSDVPRMALNLERSVRDNDQAACAEILRTLSGTAAPLGFPHISTLAIAAQHKMHGASPKEASSEVRALVVACRRIKAKPAA